MLLDPAHLRQRLEPVFQENFARFGELGAAVSVWQHGKPLIDLHGGFRDSHRQHPWTSDTIVLFWSATKGLGSACLLHVLQEQKIGLQQTVAELWPEFAQAGKEEITLAQLLSHQAGLCALDQPVDILDYAGVIRALEQQAPLWPPGTAHGYHSRTFGFLVDELIRRLAGRTASDYWRAVFAEPLHLDIWIGLPPEQNSRAATVYAAKTGKTPEPARFYRDLTKAGTLARRTFTSPHGLHSVSGMNEPALRAEPIVSFGGIGSALSLGKFYAMLANDGEMEGRKYFQRETLLCMAGTISDGLDKVFQIPTAFSAGFMKDSRNATRRILGPSATVFGHPGAGGSHAFADPENKLSFAYVMNQMEQTVLPNERALRLLETLYGLVKKS
jgi:CubicO group peptidase (beta-lactamase class C family)